MAMDEARWRRGAGIDAARRRLIAGQRRAPDSRYNINVTRSDLTPVDRDVTDTRPPHCTAGDTRAAKKCKGSPYSITERTVPQLIPVLGSQPAGDVSHKPDGRLPLLSERGLLRYQFCCLVNRGTVGVNRPLPDSVATAI